jgi:hypothetical protein
MNKISIKVIGVVCGLILLFALLFIIFAIISLDDRDRYLVLLFLIPAYFIAHFLIYYKFGFINIYSSSAYFSRSVNMFSIIILFLIFIGLFLSPLYFIYESFAQKKIEKKFYHVKKWSNDSAAFGIVGELETKYQDEKLYYKFRAKSDSITFATFEDITEYTIRFSDEDGFEIGKILVNDLIRTPDKNGKIIGHEANSYLSINIYDYSKYKSWDLIVKVN